MGSQESFQSFIRISSDMNKFLNCTLCYMLIWIASGINFNGFENHNFNMVITSLILGIVGGVYIRFIADQ